MEPRGNFQFRRFALFRPPTAAMPPLLVPKVCVEEESSQAPLLAKTQECDGRVSKIKGNSQIRKPPTNVQNTGRIQKMTRLSTPVGYLMISAEF